MKTFVKVTGLMESETVALVPDGGAAAFVIDSPASPCTVSTAAAASLLDHVPKEAEAWAVVADPTAELIHRLFDEVGVDRVQVYGRVPPDLEFLEIHHLVPSLPIPPFGSTGPEPPIPPAEDYSRLHLDAAGEPLRGGSDVRADWEMCARIVDGQPGRKLVLAGGLDAANVAEALAAVHPWGVDVSAGVESAPGRKDPEKLKAFVAAVQKVEDERGSG